MSEFCENCGEHLGFIKNYNFFCYKCCNYKKIDEDICINECEIKLVKLRENFRRVIVNENIERHLSTFMNLSELSCKFHSSPDQYNLNHKIKREFVYLNIYNLVVTTIGLNWIIEDLNHYSNKLSSLYSERPLQILQDWINFFRKKIFLENELGFFIENETGVIYFYYTKTWVLYEKSLSQFGFVEPEYISDDLDLLHGSLDQMKKFEKDKDILKKFVEKDFSLRLISSLYDVYPDRLNKLFSFEDILYDDSGMIPYALQRIYNYFDTKRSHDFEEVRNSGKPLFIKTSYADLIQSIPELPWFDKIFNLLLISSQFNPVSFPFLVKLRGDVYILPYRTRLAYIFMNEKLNHLKNHNELSKQYELRFQNLVSDILSRNGVEIKDTISNIERINIINKKSNTFEIDILGTFGDKILIIECKSIRMTPFYNLIPYRKNRESQILHFNSQFTDRIKPWILENFKKKTNSKYIEIECRKLFTNKIVLNFPEIFHNIQEEKILGLYITQLNERFKNRLDIKQIYFKNIKKVLIDIDKL